MRKILGINELGEFSGEREEYLFRMIEAEKIADGKRIALYGLGKHTERLLKFLEKHGKEVKEKICCLIDREKENINVNGYPVLKLKDAVKVYQIDCIIISSYRFQDEIYERIQNIEEDGVTVYKIYDGFNEETIERIYLFDDDELGIKKNIWSVETYYEHINRYYWALPFCIHKSVLDMACGCGYGTGIISEKADYVAGVDISQLSISYAKRHFNDENTDFVCESIYDIAFDKKFDVITSFETIEHIDDEEKYFATIKRYIKDNGVVLISTPYAEKDGVCSFNRWHVNEYTLLRFQETLQRHFKDVIYYRQELDKTCAVSVDDGTMSGAVYEKTIMLAACFV